MITGEVNVRLQADGVLHLPRSGVNIEVEQDEDGFYVNHIVPGGIPAGGGGGGGSVTVDDALSATSENPVQNKVVKAAVDEKISSPSNPTAGQFLVYSGTAWVAQALTDTEEEVVGDGAVTQALDPDKYYRFVGTLTSLTITLNPPQTGQMAWYHFDFETETTPTTLTLPATVAMPDGFEVEGGKRYEVDILNNYGTVQAWTIA